MGSTAPQQRRRGKRGGRGRGGGGSPNVKMKMSEGEGPAEEEEIRGELIKDWNSSARKPQSTRLYSCHQHVYVAIRSLEWWSRKHNFHMLTKCMLNSTTFKRKNTRHLFSYITPLSPCLLYLLKAVTGNLVSSGNISTVFFFNLSNKK